MSEVERTPISDLSLAELQSEYKNLTEAWISGRLSEVEQERRADMWRALLDRTDVEQPACPGCGARTWGFGHDQIVCRECDRATEHDEDGLRAEIQGAWNRILGDVEVSG